MSHSYQLCSEEWTEWHLTMYRLSLLDMVAVFFLLMLRLAGTAWDLQTRLE